jgi:glycosyltransferase involved in cell wall biosynthesis
MTPPITVLLAAAGQPLLVKRTLESLAACEKPSTFRGALVVENGPPCGIEQVVRSRPAAELVRYHYVPEPNKSHALNVALNLLDDGLIFFTDDDVRLDQQLLIAYARGSWGVAGGEFYGGPLRTDYEGPPPASWIRPYLPKTAQGWQLPAREQTRVAARTFLGPNWAAFAADLWRIGGFEPRLGPGAPTGSTGQETEAQHRLLAAGCRAWYLPDAIAWHYVRDKCLTPQWIVERAYRHGLEWGIRRGRQPHFRGWKQSLFWLRLARRRLLCRLMRALGDERWQLAADYTQSRRQGRWDGIAIGQRWESIPVPLTPARLRLNRRAA